MTKWMRKMAWEYGTLSREGTIKLFQQLVDSGEVWTMTAEYRAQAEQLIAAGLVKKPEVIHG